MPDCPTESENSIDLRLQPGGNCKPVAATPPTTEIISMITTVLPFCKEDDDDIFIGSFDLRSSSDDKLSGGSKNCIPMPDCPTEGENPIDLRSAQPGVNCRPVAATTTQTTDIISTTTVLPFCEDDDIGSFDLRSSSDNELLAGSKNCIPMPDCPTEGENQFDLRNAQLGVNCKPVATTTTQATEIISTTTVLPFCDDDDNVIGSFDLRSSLDAGLKNCIPMPDCPTESENSIDLINLQPGVNCKPVTTTQATEIISTTTVLPFCKEVNDDNFIGSFDLRSSSDDELSASPKNCIPMPDCPSEGENQIDLRNAQPGVNCKPVGTPSPMTTAPPSSTDYTKTGLKFDLRRS